MEPARRYSSTRNFCFRQLLLVSCIIAALLSGRAVAQQTAKKRPITHNDYDSWRTIQSPQLSRDGKYVAYSLTPEDGDGEVVVRNLTTGVEWRYGVGARQTQTTDEEEGGGGAGAPPPAPVPPPPNVQTVPSTTTPPGTIRVGGNVQSAKLVKQPVPVYPPLAKAARIQGTVQLSVLIGPDGTVQDVQLLSGHPLLVQAATDAVKQWVYQPTLLNGNPVPVLTEVDVNFTLSQ